MLPILLWCAGCATLDHDRDVRRIMEQEGCGSFRIYYADLDHEGDEEAVVVYDVGTRGSGVKVIAWRNHAPQVIFERLSGTPATHFTVIEGVPTIIFQEFQRATDSSGVQRHTLIYKWNGKTFTSSW